MSNVQMFLNSGPARLQRKQELAARVASLDVLTAGGTEVSEPVVDKFYAAVEAWLRGEDRSPESWRATVREALEPSLKAQLARVGGAVFVTNDPMAKALREAAIERAINDTEDLRLKLLHAENDLGIDRSSSKALTAASWPLSRLLNKAHQAIVANSIVRSAKARYENSLYRQRRFEAGFTGKRRFRAGDPNGRHGSIDFAVDETGEGWQLGDRQVKGRRYPPTRVLFPNDDPANVKEWSGSTAYVEYEHVDRRGRVTWHPGQEAIAPKALASTRKTGGATLNVRGSTLTKGYSVGSGVESKIVPAEEFFSPRGRKIYDDWYREQLAKGRLEDETRAVGAWYDRESGQVYFDVVDVIPDGPGARKKATELGSSRNEKKIYHLTTKQEIDTGGTGVNL